jgi:sulfopyruvate decarboxylase subunit beta
LHRIEATKVVLEQVDNRPIVSNLGPTTDELWHTGHRDRNFYTWGSMGLCSSIALGMALSTDEQIISLDGDGSLLMNLGTIASIGREKPENLIVIVWDNEEWGQTGHQSSHTAMGTDLEQVAKGCGVPHTSTVSSEEQLETVLKEALNTPGPWFIVAKIEETEHLPYAPIEPEMTLHRFRATFEDSKSNPLTEPWLYKEQSG